MRVKSGRFSDDAQGELETALTIIGIIAFIAATLMIIGGINLATNGTKSNHVGAGLMWIGGGCLIGDLGGVVIFQSPKLLIAGVAGVVLIIIGAFISLGASLF